MFPEVGPTELMVILVVALIVVGPRDLPVLLRKVGAAIARVRTMANGLRDGLGDMARHSELDALRQEIEALRTGAVAEPAAPSPPQAPVRHARSKPGAAARPKKRAAGVQAAVPANAAAKRAKAAAG